MYHPHEKEIFEYIRKRKAGRTFKVGVILGYNEDGIINVGWSKCNLKKDIFTTDAGLSLAKIRAINHAPHPPLCIQSQLRRFGARCVRYFKNANQLILPMV